MQWALIILKIQGNNFTYLELNSTFLKLNSTYMYLEMILPRWK